MFSTHFRSESWSCRRRCVSQISERIHDSSQPACTKEFQTWSKSMQGNFLWLCTTIKQQKQNIWSKHSERPSRSIGVCQLEVSWCSWLVKKKYSILRKGSRLSSRRVQINSWFMMMMTKTSSKTMKQRMFQISRRRYRFCRYTRNSTLRSSTEYSTLQSLTIVWLSFRPMLLKPVWPFRTSGMSLTQERPRRRSTTSACSWVDSRYNGYPRHQQSKGLAELEEQDLATAIDCILWLCIQKCLITVSRRFWRLP